GKSGISRPRTDNDPSFEGEVVDAMLPGKASKLQVTRNRTPNRHRWSGREYQGARENSGEGTRQNGTVTSGEGAPARVKDLLRKPRLVEDTRPLDRKRTRLNS